MRPIRAIAVAAFAFALTLSMAPLAQADGGQYTVLKCHAYSRSASEVEAAAAGPYQTADSCAGADHRLEVAVNGFGLPGQSGYVRFTAPDNTAIVGVIADANLRRDNHHFAQLAAVDYQGNSRVLAQGSDAGTGFQPYSFSGLNDLRFVVQLFCSDPGGCPNSSQAHAYVRNIALVLEDRSAPGVTGARGSLFDPGWLRDIKGLQAAASDLGSGLSSLTAAVNGTELGRTIGHCPGRLADASVMLAPCSTFPTQSQLALPMDTTSAPFVDGINQVALCVTDFAGNGPICHTSSVAVDNREPELGFANHLDPEDPELVRVTSLDPHSGIEPSSAHIAYRAVGGSEWTPLSAQLVEGELVARVNSEIEPPGEYEFTASATDRAGNQAQTDRRLDGTRMTLSFPLREPVQLAAHLAGRGARGSTLAYGRDSRASGRLLDFHGEPLADRTIDVVELFSQGALIERRTRSVTTNAKGRWKSKLPAGPSRSVVASYPGSLRHRPRNHELGELEVRGRSTFEASSRRVDEGGSVAFAGKVGHFGAQVPAGGKLVELQVREGVGRWNTVREAFHTDSSGHFRFRYRFGRFYERNASFVFRLKVAREQGWPYKAPGISPRRKVTVVATR